jgi:hypothetical protein
VFERGGYTTYFKYIYEGVPTQEPLPVTVRRVVKDIDGDFQYTYNIYCEYAVGKVTLMMRASDGGTIPITDDMFFRLVITY